MTAPIRSLRRQYISFLAAELPGKERLRQSALLEDDALELAFMEALNAGQGPFATLELAAKCEDDRRDGPCCGIGPVGLQVLLQHLGRDFGLTTLKDVKRAKALPKPFTLMNDNNHWVPMWLKSHGAKVESRPWLPVASYDLYLGKFEPAAEAAGAWVDCTARAAGDCATTPS